MAGTARTLLIVDDDAEIRALLSDGLTQQGYQILVAADGRSAYAMASGPARPDLAIIDLVMPGQEGIETIQAIRRECPEIHIVAMSGARDGTYLPLASRLGADMCLLKPFSLETLCRVLRSALDDAPSGNA